MIKQNAWSMNGCKLEVLFMKKSLCKIPYRLLLKWNQRKPDQERGFSEEFLLRPSEAAI